MLLVSHVPKRMTSHSLRYKKSYRTVILKLFMKFSSQACRVVTVSFWTFLVYFVLSTRRILEHILQSYRCLFECLQMANLFSVNIDPMTERWRTAITLKAIPCFGPHDVVIIIIYRTGFRVLPRNSKLRILLYTCVFTKA